MLLFWTLLYFFVSAQSVTIQCGGWLYDESSCCYKVDPIQSLSRCTSDSTSKCFGPPGGFCVASDLCCRGARVATAMPVSTLTDAPSALPTSLGVSTSSIASTSATSISSSSTTTPLRKPLSESCIQKVGVLMSDIVYRPAQFVSQVFCDDVEWRYLFQLEQSSLRVLWIESVDSDPLVVMTVVRGTNCFNGQSLECGANLWTDFKFAQIDCANPPGTLICEGKVHGGFYEAADTYVSAARLTVQRKADENYEPAFAGHSLGGAVASLLAFDFYKHNRIRSRVITIGCPRIGNTGWAVSYNALLGAETTRYVNHMIAQDRTCVEITLGFSRTELFCINGEPYWAADLFTRLPPGDLKVVFYAHVGNQVNLCTDLRFLSSTEVKLAGHISSGFEAHDRNLYVNTYLWFRHQCSVAQDPSFGASAKFNVNSRRTLVDTDQPDIVSDEDSISFSNQTASSTLSVWIMQRLSESVVELYPSTDSSTQIARENFVSAFVSNDVRTGCEVRLRAGEGNDATQFFFDEKLESHNFEGNINSTSSRELWIIVYLHGVCDGEMVTVAGTWNQRGRIIERNAVVQPLSALWIMVAIGVGVLLIFLMFLIAICCSKCKNK